MEKGYLSFVLHAHLPFVRHPEYKSFLEEIWLFEAISETYLPLLRALNRLKDDHIPFRITMTISPTLAAMLGDELLQDRFLGHLDKMMELAEKEVARVGEDPEFGPLARMYQDLFRQNHRDFTELYRKNILRGFRSLEKEGYLELITTSATHCYLPLFESSEEAVRAQIQVAVSNHGRIFGKPPRGFWLPECGYFPGVEKILKEYDIEYFFTAAHGLLLADERPKDGAYAPVSCPNGVKAFCRDIPSSRAVWSDTEGYPADFVYRDFYRDIGFDLDQEYIGPYIHEDGVRIHTGFKYYKITGKTDDKKPYDMAAARDRAKEHAENFVYNRLKQVKRLCGVMDNPPVVVTPYDAELFGHWWFEGPEWIEAMVRSIYETDGRLEMVSPSDYLEKIGAHQVVQPSFSSWGNNGYSEVWLDGTNDWIYRHLHKTVERMVELVRRYPQEQGLKRRVLNQAAREVLLSQASDWPFIIKNNTTVPYAIKRLKEHMHNFNRIYDDLCRGKVDTEWLTTLEKKNSIFPGIDYRVFGNLL